MPRDATAQRDVPIWHLTNGHSFEYRSVVQQQRLIELLASRAIRTVEVARELHLDPSTVSRKLSGKRTMKLDEVQALLRYLSRRLERPVSYEELFASEFFRSLLPPDISTQTLDALQKSRIY